MKPYYNLPKNQHFVQRSVDGFNTDEQLFHKVLLSIEKDHHIDDPDNRKHLDVLCKIIFETLRQPDDCIGTCYTGT
jgi:hypothetical protein